VRQSQTLEDRVRHWRGVGQSQTQEEGSETESETEPDTGGGE
jgi:hypothetical protein